MKRSILAAALTAALAAGLPAVAATASAQDSARLASQYSAWAGGRDNAEALVRGLATGQTVTLSTRGEGSSRSLAGFTPAHVLDERGIRAALGGAQRTLARLGIERPTAEQMQAALIGGYVQLPDGRVQPLGGTVAVEGGNPQVASR